MEKLYVGNLPSTATQESVEALFSQYGPIESIVLIKDRETGLFKGFGFVEFQSKEDANKALELNGTDFEGQQLKVNVARPKNPNRY